MDNRTPLLPGGAELLTSALVQKIAREYGYDLSQVQGTGPGGRITKQDLEAFLKRSTAVVPVVDSSSRATAPVEPIPSEWKDVVPHGGEVFFRRDPEAGAICDIEIEGTCQILRWWGTPEADALYEEYEGRFTQLHGKLLINNWTVKDLPYCEIISRKSW